MRPTDRKLAVAAFRASVYQDAVEAIAATIRAAMSRERLCGQLGYEDILPILAEEIRRQLDDVCDPETKSC